MPRASGSPFPRAALAAILLSAAVAAVAAPRLSVDSEAVHASPEDRLISALADMRRGAFDAALSDLNTLIERQPDFRLAHYLQAELLLARAGRPLDVALDQGENEQRRALVDEALRRWSHRLSAPPPEAVPNAVLQLASRFEHIVVVDLLRNRLYLLRNDRTRLSLVADFYASIGRAGAGKQDEGDLRTPVGIYHVTEYKADNELPELYGDGAFPVNYPNSMDRIRGRTGYGIWVHGVPRDTYSRAPRASEGCVVVANSDLQMLRRYLRPGVTPVVFTDELQWLTPEEAEEQRQTLMAQLEDWRSSWENLDTGRYLAHYADGFVSPSGMGKQAFAAHKRQVNAAKSWIELSLEDVSIYRYPGESDMALISFLQRYSSNNFQAVSRKQQFWRRDPEAGWQIVHESRVE